MADVDEKELSRPNMRSDCLVGLLPAAARFNASSLNMDQAPSPASQARPKSARTQQVSDVWR